MTYRTCGEEWEYSPGALSYPNNHFQTICTATCMKTLVIFHDLAPFATPSTLSHNSNEFRTPKQTPRKTYAGRTWKCPRSYIFIASRI